jgi:hypothetical protein
MIRESKKLVVRLSKRGTGYHCWIKSPILKKGTFLVEEEEKVGEAVIGSIYFLHNSVRIDNYDLIDDIIKGTILQRSRDIKLEKLLI